MVSLSGYGILAMLFIFFCPCTWNLLGHLEYYNHTISDLFGGDKEKGFQLVTTIIIHLQIIRNTFFYLALKSTPLSSKVDSLLSKVSILLRIIAVPLHLFGWTLSITSFYQLGFKGTYEGDCFGFTFDQFVHHHVLPHTHFIV